MRGTWVWFACAMVAVLAAAGRLDAQSSDSSATGSLVVNASASRRLTLDAAHYLRTHPIPLDSVLPGSRMRLLAHSFVTERQGVVTAIEADTFVFAMPGKHVVRRIPPSDVVASWVSVGKAPNGANALKIAGLGAIAGTALAQFFNTRSYRSDPRLLLNVTILASMGSGAVVGGIIGSLRATDVWRPIQFPR